MLFQNGYSVLLLYSLGTFHSYVQQGHKFVHAILCVCACSAGSSYRSSSSSVMGVIISLQRETSVEKTNEHEPCGRETMKTNNDSAYQPH